MHCYTNNKFYFTADTNSLVGGVTTTTTASDTTASTTSSSSDDGDGSKSMRDWVNALPLNAQEEEKYNVTWACAGERVALTDAVAEGIAPAVYCDSALTDRAVVATLPS